MPLTSPNLDDRRFSDLVEEAKTRLVRSCPEWTDLSPHDPGIVLLELFAFLTETLLYRLNRVPEKMYVEFLRLLGVQLQPPSSARVELSFARAREDLANPIAIPKGTRVTLQRTDAGRPAPVFVVSRNAEIEAGASSVEVAAEHYENVEAEICGLGTGLGGQAVSVARPPIVDTGDELDLVVGVEADANEIDERTPALTYADKVFRVWTRVESFTDPAALNVPFNNRWFYLADRFTGTVSFAPSARLMTESGVLQDQPELLAQVPAAGREIRAWYRIGGGLEGNVAAGTLTVLKDPIPGVTVTNPLPAVGGRTSETLENVLVRGSQAVHSLERAVTARDFEVLALQSSGSVIRARAFTMAALWKHAQPGTVVVLLVPNIDASARPGNRVTTAMLHDRQSELARTAIFRALDERRPLGTICIVNWARYKTVRVSARIVVHREEDPAALAERVLQRLYDRINPLPSGRLGGWRFGQALRIFDVYDLAGAEPGVSFVDQVRLIVDEVPDEGVLSTAADYSQPNTWYAGSRDTVFRSGNNGDGWEPAGRFPDEKVEIVAAHPRRAGLVVAYTRLTQEHDTGRVHISEDSGETWRMAVQVSFPVEDLAWTLREDAPVLLLATGVGLYELSIVPESVPIQVLVDPGQQNRGFFAVAVIVDARGEISVAVASQGTGGVFLSTDEGKPSTFRHIGLKNEDVRVLAVQTDGPRTFLWAGVAAVGGPESTGTGCHRVELFGSELSPEGWKAFSKEWRGGSCRALAFQGLRVLAATHQAGVLWLDSSREDAAWERPDINANLPKREVGRVFQPVLTVAADPAGKLLLAGGQQGIYRSRDGGRSYDRSSTREYLDKVTLPETWLFCSGEHELKVVSEDEAE